MSDAPYMPDVDADDPTQQACFAMAREISKSDRAVALVTPGRMVMPIPAPEARTMPSEMVHEIQRIIAEKEPKHITVIAFNNVILQSAIFHSKPTN